KRERTILLIFFFQAEDGIRDRNVTGVQTCALPIYYASHCGFLPDAVFGWELPEHQRKPNAYPIREILKRFHIPEHAALVLDDSKPGLDMANSCNVDFASAGWSHSIPEIKNQMKKESLYYFETVQQFNQLVLQNMPVE